MQLPFGMDASMPLDFKFNNVPHPAWVRSYLYDGELRYICYGPCAAIPTVCYRPSPTAAAEAVLRAVSDPSIQDKSRLQMRVNFPEVGAIIAVITSKPLLLPHHLHCAFIQCT